MLLLHWGYGIFDFHPLPPISTLFHTFLLISTTSTLFWGSLKRSARAVRAQCNYLGVWPSWRPML